MKSITTSLPLIVAVIVVIAGTVVHGVITDRWAAADSESLQLFTARVPLVPTVIGDWEGQDDQLSDKQFEMTNCTAYVSRRYVNRKSGDVVSVYLVSGTARHITIHTPDWCYQGAGYKMVDKPTPITVDCGDAMTAPEFSAAAFFKPDPVTPQADTRLQIFWTYSDDGVWLGPKLAKIAYSGRPALYKVYLINNTMGRDLPFAESPCVAFAQELMPMLDKILFSDSGSESVSPQPAQEQDTYDENDIDANDLILSS